MHPRRVIHPSPGFQGPSVSTESVQIQRSSKNFEAPRSGAATLSSISNTLCADACAGSYPTASQWATQALGTQTCLGAYAGCCQYYVDQNFNRCGG